METRGVMRRWRGTAFGLALLLHGAVLALLLMLQGRPAPVPPDRPISSLDLDAVSPPVQKGRPSQSASSLHPLHPKSASIPSPPKTVPPQEAPVAALPPPDAVPTPPVAVPAPPVAPADVQQAEASPGGAAAGTPSPQSGEPDYVPQYEITDVPVIPVAQVLSRIEYPPLAARQGIEATVYVELYIDSHGAIRKVVVLKDPGYGFAEAAVKALQGVMTTPARANGRPVAVRFRYPIRFKLK